MHQGYSQLPRAYRAFDGIDVTGHFTSPFLSFVLDFSIGVQVIKVGAKDRSGDSPDCAQNLTG